MSLTEKHHAIIRFVTYLSLLLCWYYFSAVPLVLIAVILLLSSYSYRWSHERTVKRVHWKDDIPTDDGMLPAHDSGCTRPTSQNPYMNVTMADRMDGMPRSGACQHPAVNQEIQRIERDEIGYRDTHDLFDRSASQRSFYTMPNTSYPDDQQSFLQYLYPMPPTCKEQPERCQYFELLQAKRQF